MNAHRILVSALLLTVITLPLLAQNEAFRPNPADPIPAQNLAWLARMPWSMKGKITLLNRPKAESLLAEMAAAASLQEKGRVFEGGVELTHAPRKDLLLCSRASLPGWGIYRKDGVNFEQQMHLHGNSFDLMTPCEDLRPLLHLEKTAAWARKAKWKEVINKQAETVSWSSPLPLELLGPQTEEEQLDAILFPEARILRGTFLMTTSIEGAIRSITLQVVRNDPVRHEEALMEAEDVEERKRIDRMAFEGATHVYRFDTTSKTSRRTTKLLATFRELLD